MELSGFIPSIISFAVVILLLFTLVLTKKLHYAVSGLTLISIGSLPMLYAAGLTGIDIGSFPILRFAAYFFLAIAARDLFREAFREKGSVLKWPTFFFAFLVLMVLAIPTMKGFGVEVPLPELPELMYNIIYVISGVLLIAGIFTMEHGRAD